MFNKKNVYLFYRVDYGHEEVKVKFGNDPRKFSTLTKEFLDDGELFFLRLNLAPSCEKKSNYLENIDPKSVIKYRT